MSVDFFRERHEAQISRGQHFLGQTGTLITGMSVIGGIIGYFVARFSAASAANFWLFWSFIFFSIFFFGLSIFFLVRSYYCPRLVDLAPSSLWFKHLTQLKKRHARRPQDALKKFEEDLIERYAEAATHNQNANDRTGYTIENATRFLIGALCAVVLSAPPFFYSNQPAGWNFPATQVKEKRPMTMENTQREAINRGGGPGNVPRPGEIPRPNPSPRPPGTER